MFSRRGTFGNSFYHIGGTQSTPLSGDSQVTAFADKALFSVRNETGFCYVALKFFQHVTSSFCIYRECNTPIFFQWETKAQSCFFSRKFMAKQRKKILTFLSL